MLSKNHSPSSHSLSRGYESASRGVRPKDRCRLLRLHLQLRASRVLSAQPFPAAGAPASPPPASSSRGAAAWPVLSTSLRVERPRGQCCPQVRCPEAIGPKLLTLPPARSFSSSSPRVKPRATGVRLSALQLIIAADRGHTDAIQLLLRRGTQANFVVAAVLVSEKHCSSAAAGVASVGGRD